MRWFEGSIPAAIASAKQQSLIFVVVITGDDEQSLGMVASWEDGRVAETSLSSCVAIKVDAKSETCVQFSQIYPVVCIPSSFFIGENGIPLEVIAGSIPADELARRIDKVKQMHAQQMGRVDPPSPPPAEAEAAPVQPPPPAEPSPAPAQEPALPPAPPALEPQPAPTPDPDPDTDTEPAAMPDTSTESPSPEEAAPTEVTAESSEHASEQPDDALDARVDRLTKKLEERREQKKKGEEESEIKREMERRKMGKEMLDFKKKQEDEKTRRLLEERSREKREEKAARDRVKQQIALDRADRAARYAQTQQEVEAARQAQQEARQAEQEARQEALHRERSAVARIQFRLPDGSSFTNQFPSESRLQEAHQFAAQEVGNRYGNFSLATMFPRREFGAADMEQTLLELELAPSASVVLLPQSGRPAGALQPGGGVGGVWAMLGSLLYPLLVVWRLLSGFLFSSPAPPTGPAHRPAAASSSSSSSGEPKRESLRKRTLEKRPEDFKKDGKIYRLRTQEDSEDDNNTWNGNSTQQM